MIKYLAFSIPFLFLACTNEVFYEQELEIENASWNYDDPLEFEFEIKDTSSYYDLLLQVDHDVDYVYENTYVKIHTSFPNGEKVSDEVSLQLADDLDQWEGKCSGDNCSVDILLQKKVRFKDEGVHRIGIEQFNRMDPLEGISGMTFRILLSQVD